MPQLAPSKLRTPNICNAKTIPLPIISLVLEVFEPKQLHPTYSKLFYINFGGRMQLQKSEGSPGRADLLQGKIF